MRENIFTVFARAINDFANHKISKKELYNIFVNCVEIADDMEKEDREIFLAAMSSYQTNVIIPNSAKSEIPYSNWNEAYKVLEK